MELNETFNKAVEASRALNLTDVSRIDAVLLALADAAEAKMEFILEANRRDLALMDEQNPMSSSPKRSSTVRGESVNT